MKSLDWMEWQKKIIREEYVEGKQVEKIMGKSEIRKKDVDEEELQVVEIYQSQPHEFTYLIFLEK
jgi:hypothetical protein